MLHVDPDDENIEGAAEEFPHPCDEWLHIGLVGRPHIPRIGV